MKPEPIIIKDWQVFAVAALLTLTIGVIFVVMTLQPMLALAHDIHQLRLETEASRAKHNAFTLESAQRVAAATQRLTASTQRFSAAADALQVTTHQGP